MTDRSATTDGAQCVSSTHRAAQSSPSSVGTAFPCQQPMLHLSGVTEIPKFGFTPDYSAKKLDTDTW
ncbi:MAG: arabinosyltransferase C-terminal domain-containing protein [Mycobacterium sp.]